MVAQLLRLRADLLAGEVRGGARRAVAVVLGSLVALVAVLWAASVLGGLLTADPLVARSVVVLVGTAVALGCTLIPYALSLVALRHMSAFAAQLAVNLEPVYAIVLAIVLLREQRELTPQFYAGVAIILGAVLLYPLISRPQPLRHPEVLGTAEAKGMAE